MIEFSPFWSSGLADGVGICGAVGLVFFAGFLSFLCRRGILLALAGATYIIAAFWTMVSVGVGLFSRLIISDVFLTVSRFVYLAVGAVFFVLGTLNFRGWLMRRRMPAPQGTSSEREEGNILKLLGYCFFVVFLAGAAGFLLTILASLRVPQPYVTAMVYAFSVEEKIWEAVLGMMVYAFGYVAPAMAVWIGIFALRQLRRKGWGPGPAQIKLMAAAVFWALSAGLFYVFV